MSPEKRGQVVENLAYKMYVMEANLVMDCELALQLVQFVAPSAAIVVEEPSK